ncbi:prominin-1-like isoform X6 [Eriocheir sinensis]|uniref:prominin-1-like isoform X6 n=1 Tax=Eriocheir sinensis TaxID=95602 RepID=UPI0021C5B706|nr:prominin-1-like isoform X6 [Eriocheir sinensis]
MALPHPRVLVAALSLVLLLAALTGANANSPLDDPELDLLLDPVTSTDFATPEDTRLLQDVYENSVSGKSVTQAPQPAVEEPVTPTRGRGGKRRRNRKKKKQEERLAAETEALTTSTTTTTTVAATLTAEVTTGLMERLEVEAASTTVGGPVKEEIVADAPRIAYSRAWVNKSYRAREDFNPRGMEHLYLITNLFLSLVHREREVPKEIESVMAQELAVTSMDQQRTMRVVSELEANWDVLLIHYIGLVALVLVGALVVVIMPLAGLFFACCRCAGRCGAQEPHYDKKRDPCKRATLGTFLAVLVVVILLGLVCSFVTNARMEEGVQSLPKKWSLSVHDTKLFLNNTDNEVQNLLVRNYRELQSVLYNKLDSSGELVKSELARVTKAVAIDNLTAIASSLSVIKKDLWEIKNTTLQLQEQTSNLQSGLEDVARRLLELQQACESLPECRTLINKYADKLTINNDFDRYLETDVLPQLPNVESKIDEVTNLIENDIEIVVKRGKRSFDSIATEIQNKVQSSIPEIKAKILDVGGQLEDRAEKIHHFLQPVDLSEPQEPHSIPQESNTYLRQINSYLRVMQDGINEYAMYRYWGAMGLCILLLVITLCFTLGVVFGCCGRRPDEASSCHKSTGASWLMCGVGLTFLFSAVIMACTTILFVVGSVSEIMVCNPLSDPMHSELFSVTADFYNLEHLYPPGEAPKITEIISMCHKNLSMYTVLSLDKVDNNLAELQDYKNRLNLHEKIAQLKSDIRVNTNVEILSKKAKEQLWELANSSVADKDTWNYYTDILEKKVLTIDLMELAALLNQTADQLPHGHHQVSFKLKNDALFLEGLQRWVTSIGSLTRNLKKTTARLNEHLKFNKTSLREAIVDLISQAEFAQDYLQVNGSQEVTELVERFSKDFLADVDEYVLHVQTAVENDVGRCGPVSTIYNATTSAVCKDIMYPFNGYWASVGWVFFFFLPAMILAVHLASLYRKTEPYPGPLNESEYLYDAYDERNSFPMSNSAYDKKQRRRSREHEGYVSSSYTADQPYSGSRASPPRTEYINTTDWADYPPSGGPPRYTSQPSLSPEYERPPPYYYPGPGPHYYGGPPPGAGPAAGGMQVHPPPPGNPPPGPQGPTNFIHGPAPWNPQQRTINIGGWKISQAYSRDEYDA